MAVCIRGPHPVPGWGVIESTPAQTGKLNERREPWKKLRQRPNGSEKKEGKPLARAVNIHGKPEGNRWYMRTLIGARLY